MLRTQVCRQTRSLNSGSRAQEAIEKVSQYFNSSGDQRIQRRQACKKQPEDRSKKMKVNVQRPCGSDWKQSVFKQWEDVLQLEVGRQRGEWSTEKLPEESNYTGPGWQSKEFVFYSKHNRKEQKYISREAICPQFHALRCPSWRTNGRYHWVFLFPN